MQDSPAPNRKRSWKLKLTRDGFYELEEPYRALTQEERKEGTAMLKRRLHKNERVYKWFFGVTPSEDPELQNILDNP